MKALGDRLKQRRQELGLTQVDIASRLGLSKATVSLWENGANKPNGKNLHTLAKILETSSEWLLSGKSSAADREGCGVPIYDLDSCPINSGEAKPSGYAFEDVRIALDLSDECFAYKEKSPGLEPRIMRGEFVIIDPDAGAAESGRTYLLKINDELILAIIQKTPSGLVATFHNHAPGWEPIPVTQDQIVGIMAGFIPSFAGTQI